MSELGLRRAIEEKQKAEGGKQKTVCGMRFAVCGIHHLKFKV
jgi:hypothetical protein